jgi:hypothetical protein
MLDPSHQQLVIQLHLLATLFMTGIVWHNQIVGYPGFRFIANDQQENAAQFLRKRAGWIVRPIMLIELGTAILLMGSSWVMRYGNYLWVNLALLLFIWGVTLLKMVPLNRQLVARFDEETIKSLVTVNWVRTMLWTVRAGLLLNFLG